MVEAVNLKLLCPYVQFSENIFLTDMIQFILYFSVELKFQLKEAFTLCRRILKTAFYFYSGRKTFDAFSE